MIEDKKLGLKIPEDKEEHFWFNIVEDAKKQQEGLEKQIQFNLAVLEMAKNKLEALKNANNSKKNK